MASSGREFAVSSTGTLLIRVWEHPLSKPKPREATDADRDRWPGALRLMLATISPAFAEGPNDPDEEN